MIVVAIVEVYDIAEILYFDIGFRRLVGEIKQFTDLRVDFQVTFVLYIISSRFRAHVANVSNVFLLLLIRIWIFSRHLKDFEELAAAVRFVILPESLTGVRVDRAANYSMERLVALADSSALIPLSGELNLLRRVNELVECLKSRKKLCKHLEIKKHFLSCLTYTDLSVQLAVQVVHDFAEALLVTVQLDHVLGLFVEVNVDEDVEQQRDELDPRPSHCTSVDQDLVIWVEELET